MGVNFCCDVYHAYEKVGRIEIKNGELLKNEVYTSNILFNPFGRIKTFINMADALKERVFCESRFTPELAENMGIQEYNIYNILHNTHGADVDDFIWLKFDGEDITWDDVNPRKEPE